jgi:hypothetical protein
MAKIWPVCEGASPTRGEPWAELPLSEAISLFELDREGFVSELTRTPRFGDTDDDLWYLGYRHIVVEIDPSESRRAKWQPGFYRSRVKPQEAFRRLIQQALVTELGQENVIRVEYEPTADSRGQDALGIMVVIKPKATKKLATEAPLKALVSLRKRLREMRDDRTPIIQYATEAELAQDASS